MITIMATGNYTYFNWLSIAFVVLLIGGFWLVQRYGRRAAATAADVEVVVNNAGVLKMAGPLDGDAIDLLDFQMKINVVGLMRVARAFAPVLRANGGGVLAQPRHLLNQFAPNFVEMEECGDMNWCCGGGGGIMPGGTPGPGPGPPG